MKNAWKHVIWWKRKCIKVLPNIDEENLGSFDHEKDQKRKKKWMRNRERNRRDRQKETFEKFRFDSYMFQNFKIWSDERNRVGIENNIEKGSISPEESGRNQGNLRLLKENSIFLLHILIDQRKGSIGRVSKNKKFWKFWTTFSAKSFEKQFLWYDRYVHDFKGFSKLNFSKEKVQILWKILQSFLSSLPKMH